ncbi:MAG: cupin domain-containing protein [Gammaproteobacteria bacterium]|nr:cupin domain-containing protein [Gammaproteobacteria bacterium]
MRAILNIPRRVVTGHKNGIATIISDGTVEDVMTHESGFVVSDIWATDSMPANLAKSAKIEDSFFPVIQPKGTLLRQVVIPPDSSVLKHFEPQPDQPHPLMHKTKTLDYIIILSGEVYLVMEDTETLLKAGDMVIQCATNHAWSNRTDKPCIQLAILLDARE